MKRLFLTFIFLAGIVSLGPDVVKSATPPLSNSAIVPLATVSDSMQIYYKYSQNGPCFGPVTIFSGE